MVLACTTATEQHLMDCQEVVERLSNGGHGLILSNKAHHVYERLLSWSQSANELQDLQQQLLSLMTFLTAGAITMNSHLG